jgi:Uma2 family endonuclease
MKTLERIEKSPYTGFKSKAFKEPETTKAKKEIIYPESDGKPMAENTVHYEWIVKVIENLKKLYRKDPDVFVAGDLLWYPVEGRIDICYAPDAMVVFGRPKGRRGSYKTWEEHHIAPHVVFEILSPNNTKKEMEDKLQSYERYGVEEYYLYDPDNIVVKGWMRTGAKLVPIAQMNGWISPRLEIRFVIKDELVIIDKNGKEFLSTISLVDEYEGAVETAKAERQRANVEQRKAETEWQRANAEQRKAEAERQRAEAERMMKERLAAKLRELGIDPETV